MGDRTPSGPTHMAAGRGRPVLAWQRLSDGAGRGRSSRRAGGRFLSDGDMLMFGLQCQVCAGSPGLGSFVGTPRRLLRFCLFPVKNRIKCEVGGHVALLGAEGCESQLSPPESGPHFLPAGFCGCSNTCFLGWAACGPQAALVSWGG